MWPEAFQTSMDDCNDDRCPGLSDKMDRCHLRDEHPGVHDFEGKSHLELQLSMTRPQQDFRQRTKELLERARILILAGRAIHSVGQEDWFDAQQEWLEKLEIHLRASGE